MVFNALQKSCCFSKFICGRYGSNNALQSRKQFSNWVMKIRNAERASYRVLFTRLKSKMTKRKQVTPNISWNTITASPKQAKASGKAQGGVTLTPQGIRGSVRRNPWKLVMIIIPITTFGLGTWQIFRLQWKINLISELERKTKLPPMTIPTDILDQVTPMEYCRVSVTGYFDHSKELHMQPRTLNTSSDPLSRKGSEPGALVVTPFFCQELGEWILINRGWVPRKKIDPETRKKGQVNGEVSLTAVVRTPEKKGMFTPENKPAENHWAFKDVAAMATHAGTIPLFLDADATTTVRGGPIGGQTKVTLRNDHLNYIFTWYSLALATSYMFYKFWTKGR